MALEGSLKEFGLADILQLILFQRKSGTLTLKGPDRVRLIFNDGNIILAESSERDIEKRLGRMLTSQELISNETLKDALKSQKEKGAKLGSILVTTGFVTTEKIQEMLTFLITETLVQVFLWKGGKYEFKPQVVPTDKDIPIMINTEHLLMEGLRFVDEWSTIKDKISVDTVFDRDFEYSGALTEEEEKILNLVNSENDVSIITDLTGIDSFTVSTVLLKLQEKGAVTLEKKREEPEEIKAQQAVPGKRRPTRLKGLGFILMLLIMGAFALSVASVMLHTEINIQRFMASEKIDALRLHIIANYYKKGSYPASIDAVDPWGKPYVYGVTEDGISLKSAGPDGQPGTPDDIY